MRFADLIAPVSSDDFFARYWENTALHVPGPEKPAIASLFALADLDHLVARMPATATIRLARASHEGTSSRMTRAGASELTSLFQSFDGGHTIIVDRMHALWRPVTELCRDLFIDMGMQVQANLYVTPSRAAGFGCHWDGHDVLILQLEGSKVWSVYKRDAPLPRPNSDGASHDGASTPDLEVTLQPGDVLYIPRGSPHQARTSAEASVHLTVGLIATTWEDLLAAGVESLVVRHPQLRKSLPPGWLRDPQAVRRASDEPRRLMRELSDDRYVAEGLDLLASQMVQSAPYVPDGHFGQLGLVDDIDPESVLTRREGVLLHASHRNGQAKLAFPGSFICGPSKLFWAFEYIAASHEFRVAAIPGWYSDAERVLVARALVRTGCLRVLAPAQAKARSAIQIGASA